MRAIYIFAALAVLTAPAAADDRVNGYFKNNGTYVAPYSRTSPNNSLMDNYSTQGNTNPYTGRQGTVNPYSPPAYTPPAYTPPNRSSTYGNSGRRY